MPTASSGGGGAAARRVRSRGSKSASRASLSIRGSLSSSGSSTGSIGSSLHRHHQHHFQNAPLYRAGSSSFHVGRERDRATEMELFSQPRKPRSNYRRPSNLGLSSNPLPSKTEIRDKFAPVVAGRSHIVPRTKDNLRPEGSFVKETEVRAKYRNLSPTRPFIHKIHDTLKPEGKFLMHSETNSVYVDKRPARPVIHKLSDHGEYVQPMLIKSTQNSEYRTSFAKAPVGERAVPPWLENFQKVTIDGGDPNHR